MSERLAHLAEYKFAIITIMAWAARLAFMSGITVALVIRQLIISIFVGYVGSEYVLSTGYDGWIQTSIFAALVFLADDVLQIVLKFGARISKDNKLIQRIVCNLIGAKK